MDNLNYHHPKNSSQQLVSNQLTYVDDLVGASTYPDELTDQAAANYTYDVMGRLVGDVQRDALISYTSSGLVSEVRTHDGTKLREQNTYDESGLLIKKQSYNSNGVLAKKEYWVYNSSGRAISYYEEPFSPSSQGIQLKNNYVYDVGRLATVDRGGAQADYSYELKDHIGNVRATFGSSSSTTYTHSFFDSETDGWRCNSGEGCFSGEEGFEILESGLTFDRGISLTQGRYTFSMQLNGAISAPLELQVKNAQGAVVASQVFTNTSSLSLSFAAATAQTYTLALVIPVSRTEISLIVESVSVKQTQLQVLSYADYYPFGWEMPGRQYTDAGADPQHGYQGDYARKNPDLQWSSFELRNFDSRLGRWLSVDPAAQYHSLYMAMGNNPISVIDPDGAWGYYNETTGEFEWLANRETGTFEKDGMTWTLVSENFEEFKERMDEQLSGQEGSTNESEKAPTVELSDAVLEQMATENKLKEQIVEEMIKTAYPELLNKDDEKSLAQLSYLRRVLYDRVHVKVGEDETSVFVDLSTRLDPPAERDAWEDAVNLTNALAKDQAQGMLVDEFLERVLKLSKGTISGINVAQLVLSPLEAGCRECDLWYTWKRGEDGAVLELKNRLNYQRTLETINQNIQNLKLKDDLVSPTDNVNRVR
jgi:RHS repeat-associated protein